MIYMSYNTIQYKYYNIISPKSTIDIIPCNISILILVDDNKDKPLFNQSVGQMNMA